VSAREVLHQLRVLVLGETRALPIAVAVALVVAGAARLVAGPGGWFEAVGGPLVVLLVVAALTAALPGRWRGGPGASG